jgi:glycosyltransferase involved in cell wall biosynthesis
VRVLHVETGRHLYGGARQVGYLIAGLERFGVDSTLVTVPEHALGIAIGAAAWVPIACAGDLDLAFCRRLRRVIRAVTPDLVHVHSRRAADTLGGRAARAEGLPAVLTRRVQSREPAAWIRFKCRPYAAVAAISSVVRAELSAAGVAAGRLHSIASAVDTDLFQPDAGARARLLARYALPADAVVVACAAQLIPRKEIASLLPLAEALVRQEPRFRLLVFGQGPMRSALLRKIRRRGLEHRVQLCGYAADWPALLPGVDLLLHPARREGLGAALLEAMSAGVPVVASAAGGIRDVISDGVDGRLVASASVADWYRTVADLLRDPSARAGLGAAAQRTVAQRFTIAQMSARYFDVYENVLA